MSIFYQKIVYNIIVYQIKQTKITLRNYFCINNCHLLIEINKFQTLIDLKLNWFSLQNINNKSILNKLMLILKKSHFPLQQQKKLLQSENPKTKKYKQNQKGSIVRFKKPKKFSFLKDQISLSNDYEQSKIEQSSFYKKKNSTQIMENIRTNQLINKIKQTKNDEIKDSSKQTFKDFIKKIQTFNKNKFINEMIVKNQNKLKQKSNQSNQIINQTEICIKSTHKKHINEQTPEDSIQISSNEQNCISNYVQNYTLKDQSKQQRSQISLSFKNKDQKFIIHQNPNKTLYSRQYRRSKTQQQIKPQIIDLQNNTFFTIQNQSKQTSIEKNQNNNTFYANHSNKVNKSLNHVSLKLMHEKSFDRKNRKLKKLQQEKNNQAFTPSFNKLKQNDLTKHQKLLQTKFSNIRIRFGSSFYNKNLKKLETKYSKETLRKQFQTICSQEIIENTFYKNHRRTNPNSLFCQSKILEAQQAFIQKRRLVPTAGSGSREDLNKMNKKFFSIANTSKKNRTIQYESVDRKKKAQNLNGWQISDEGPTHYKIQQFF